ncbi:hypothetical protein Tco_0972021 [Tanacetum coccineum]
MPCLVTTCFVRFQLLKVQLSSLFPYLLSPLRIDADSEDEVNESPNLDHQNDPSIPQPPPEPPDIKKCLKPEAGILIIKEFKGVSKSHDFMTGILPTLSTLVSDLIFISSFVSFENEDTIFDPGIVTFLEPVAFSKTVSCSKILLTNSMKPLVSGVVSRMDKSKITRKQSKASKHGHENQKSTKPKPQKTKALANFHLQGPILQFPKVIYNLKERKERQGPNVQTSQTTTVLTVEKGAGTPFTIHPSSSFHPHEVSGWVFDQAKEIQPCSKGWQKEILKKTRCKKESESKQGRKSAKGEPSVHKDPLYDEMGYMETEDAQDVGRKRDVVNEEKENADAKQKVSTDGSKVSTDKEKYSTDRTDEGTDDQTKGRRATQTIQTKTSTMFGDDETIAQIDPKDKGKKKIEEEDESKTESEGIPKAEKKFKQLASDEEMAKKLQED